MTAKEFASMYYWWGGSFYTQDELNQFGVDAKALCLVTLYQFIKYL